MGNMPDANKIAARVRNLRRIKDELERDMGRAVRDKDRAPMDRIIRRLRCISRQDDKLSAVLAAYLNFTRFRRFE